MNFSNMKKLRKVAFWKMQKEYILRLLTVTRCLQSASMYCWEACNQGQRHSGDSGASTFELLSFPPNQHEFFVIQRIDAEQNLKYFGYVNEK